jgi:class 3 adenylate cyclase
MSEWAIMFVDMVGSTEFKYKYHGSVEQTFKALYTLIRDHSKGREHIKFTGDGAMVIFRHIPENNGCQYALRAAKDIIRAVDRRNLTFASPPAIHIRVGIASGNPAKGECYELSTEPELSGTKVDLAARLCQETDPDTILVDIRTMENSKLPAHLFVKCEQRLPLKGIPRPDNEEEHYYFESDRLLRTPKGDNFSKGLLALYPDREALNRDFTPARLMMTELDVSAQ